MEVGVEDEDDEEQENNTRGDESGMTLDLYIL